MRTYLIAAAALAAVLLGGRLPVERDIERFPDLRERFGYTSLRLSQPQDDTALLQLNDTRHRELDENELLARALEVAGIVRSGTPELADKVVLVELGWTWHSDLYTRRQSVRHAFAP